MDAKKATTTVPVLLFRYNILIIVTLVLGLFSTFITYWVSENSVKNFQIQKIQSLALIIDTDRVKSLTGSPDDTNNPAYKRIKEQLMKVRQVNPEIRFLYLMKSEENKIFFLIDSEDPNSADYSAPGDEYDEASEVFKSAFVSAKTGFELYRDRWGYWLSSFSPIVDIESGKNIAVFGVDIDAYSQYFFPIIKVTMLPIIVFSFLLIILLINRRYMLFQIEAMKEKEAILHVLSHEVRTPLTEIRWSCEAVMEEGDFKQDSLVKSSMIQVFTSSIQMIQRINNLEKAIALSDTTKIDLKNINISELINETLNQFVMIAKLREVELINDLSELGKSNQIQADPELLGLALQNILLNQIYYADPKTMVSVSCRIDKIRNRMEIIISGRGKQIPLDEIDLVFAGYHRGVKFSQHTEGTGIGLFLAKEIIVLHHGEIRVSVVDKDTIFTIELGLVG